MIFGLCGDGEIEIQGDVEGLLILSRTISENPGISEILLDMGIDPAPYNGFIKMIRIMRTDPEDGLVEISQTGDELSIRGCQDRLMVLGSNIQFLVKQGVDPHSIIQDHIHVEYWEGHPYLSARSLPLVISYITRATSPHFSN